MVFWPKAETLPSIIGFAGLCTSHFCSHPSTANASPPCRWPHRLLDGLPSSTLSRTALRHPFFLSIRLSTLPKQPCHPVRLHATLQRSRDGSGTDDCWRSSLGRRERPESVGYGRVLRRRSDDCGWFDPSLRFVSLSPALTRALLTLTRKPHSTLLPPTQALCKVLRLYWFRSLAIRFSRFAWKVWMRGESAYHNLDLQLQVECKACSAKEGQR
jgi:hypothetical protein